jgi:hypothetical protein
MFATSQELPPEFIGCLTGAVSLNLKLFNLAISSERSLMPHAYLIQTKPNQTKPNQTGRPTAVFV